MMFDDCYYNETRYMKLIVIKDEKVDGGLIVYLYINSLILTVMVNSPKFSENSRYDHKFNNL